MSEPEASLSVEISTVLVKRCPGLLKGCASDVADAIEALALTLAGVATSVELNDGVAACEAVLQLFEDSLHQKVHVLRQKIGGRKGVN